jgi:uncharacterized protein
VTAAPDFYHDGARTLQDIVGTRQLADHIADRYVEGVLSADAVAMIVAADCFYLATADAAGRPDCSYKGGLPGFVHVLSPTEIAFPSYDGNGMFRSLGNILVNPAVGLLFVDLGGPLRLRVNGDAVVRSDAAAMAAHPGADVVVRVTVREAFENCPRYLHDRVNGRPSVHCPRPDYQPPDADWKAKPEYDSILRAASPDPDGLA